MKKELKIRRKVSAIVAMALALVVTFIAAVDTYGDSAVNAEEKEELSIAIAEAYDEVVTYEHVEDFTESAYELIKIFDAEDQLIEEVKVAEDGAIEDLEIQKLVNKAEYLSSYNNTKVYRLLN